MKTDQVSTETAEADVKTFAEVFSLLRMAGWSDNEIAEAYGLTAEEVVAARGN